MPVAVVESARCAESTSCATASAAAAALAAACSSEETENGSEQSQPGYRQLHRG